MFEKLKKKIECKRKSRDIYSRILVKLKDFAWKSSLVLSRVYWRLMNRGKLPDFLIIGVQKAGTTSLWRHLRQHPFIEMSPNFVSHFPKGGLNIKEPFFFNSRLYKGINWYKSLFNDNGKLQGEATADYLSDNKCHKFMHKFVPNAKLIVLLREPVSRFYSSFNHMKQRSSSFKGYSPYKTLEENMKEEIKSGFKEGLIRMGFYIAHINSLLKFYPRKQVLIILSDDMKKNPQEVYNKVFDFLNIKRIKINYIPNVHKRKYTVPISVETKERLYKIYKPYNKRLFRFLGYKIKEWSKPQI